MNRRRGILLCLALMLLLAACGPALSGQNQKLPVQHSIASDSLRILEHATPTPDIVIPSLHATPTPAPNPYQPPSTTGSSPKKSTSPCITYSNDTTRAPSGGGKLAAPYGQAPSSAEAQQLAQQLFALVNHDRAACGLPAFRWNSTLANGARLHSWNMYHCGFSHYCPDGMSPYQRIANEGYGGATDCGELIGEAGPYPTPWGGVYNIQESMAHEAVNGWHRIHLFSTTLHQMGIGIYVDPSGSIWFTEDVVS